MAVFTGPRVRDNNVFGTTTDNPLTNVATTMNSAGLANLSAVSSAHAVLILDPLRAAGAPEIVIVTAHTGAATSATITRGALGTSARQHASGTLWVLAPTIDDVIRIVTSSTRPADTYEGEVIYETDTDSLKAYVAAWENVVMLGGWTSYTPTLTQSATVTKTVNYAKYMKVGRTVVASFDLSVTGAGTTANAVAIGLPVAAATSFFPEVGALLIYDASTTTRYNGGAELSSTTTFGLSYNQANAALWGLVPNLALASGDIIRGTVTYEAAS